MTFREVTSIIFLAQCIIFTFVCWSLAVWIKAANSGSLSQRSLFFYLKQSWSFDQIDENLTDEAKRRAGRSRIIMWSFFAVVVMSQWLPIIVVNRK